MRLLNKKIEQIIIDVTPDMRGRVHGLNQSAMEDLPKIEQINRDCRAMQYESMLKADKENFYGQ